MRLPATVLMLVLAWTPALAQTPDDPRVRPLPNDGPAEGVDYEWTLVGKASAVDGDTIIFRGVRMRLYGIDAPELDQTCLSARGIPWGCGVAAKVRLQELIGDLPLRCFGHGSDKYGRNLVQCWNDSWNLNNQMVREGMAVEFSRYAKGKFASEQRQAQQNRHGLWSGEFAMPWDYRAAQKKAKPRV